MKIYITLIKHCIDQIKKRNTKHYIKYNPESWAKYVFTEFITKGEWKGRKVRYSYSRNGKYKITDGEHYFIYKKPYKIEYTIVTYIKKKFSPELLPKENYIKKDQLI